MHTDLSATPYYHANWLASIEYESPVAKVEIPLFSDARIVGDQTADCGPFQFVKVQMSTNQRGFVKPTLVVRFAYYIERRGQWSETGILRINTFQGGRPIDEIAALASLALGVRLKAGEISRVFDEDGDPLGTPHASESRREFLLLRGGEGFVLPAVCDSSIREASLTDLKPFEILPRLSPTEAIALLRAARLYQDALWIAETDPSLAWVMLVSAVETAATHWQSGDADPLETIQELDHDLHEILDGCDNEDLVARVASATARRLKSTRRFVEFSISYLPPPPSKRPENENRQHPWKSNSLKRTMSYIYGRRSAALHEGQPFPLPLCETPATDARGAYQEVPLGDGYSSWKTRDYPIMLQTYEHIVRGSLLKWWKSMGSE